ncbi:hypothetical protein [Anaerocolumna xylanovorans]|uniref:hypothetical protein n=1 Tax=Anaerocolumna xylanovorans TaxID=100134 RepID=UPI001FA84FAC|nr:hypothetical protein [Anaerocolumna xylanovorans]
MQVVNSCKDAVNIIQPDGRKEDINKKYDIQRGLQNRYHENRGRLPLSLDIPNSKDYLRIVYYSIDER